MNKETLYNIIDNLLQDCYNDLFECENDVDEDTAKIIYHNVELFTLKLKDKLEDEVQL